MNDNLPPGVGETDIDCAAGVPRKRMFPGIYMGNALTPEEREEWDAEAAAYDAEEEGDNG